MRRTPKAVFLPFDLESGGSSDECTILTAHFAACDGDWNIQDELSLSIKPNNGQYVVTARGLAVNGIDITEHDKLAITESEAQARLKEFLWANTGAGTTKLIPAGKGVHADIARIRSRLIDAKDFSSFISNRAYDIGSLILFLKQINMIEKDAPESLEDMCRRYAISSEWHTARGDNIAAIKLVKELERLCNGLAFYSKKNR